MTTVEETSQIGQFPIKREDFVITPIVSKWHDLNPNRVQARKMMSKLLIICNTLRKKPDEFIQDKDTVTVLKETILDFKKIVDAGNIQHTHEIDLSKSGNSYIPNSYQEYEASLKSFLGCYNYIPPQAKVFQNKKPYHYPVFLNDEEITTVFRELKELVDKRFVICATIQHEIFCRFESAFLKWNVDNVEIIEEKLDGIHFKYAKLDGFYEPKQHEHFDKIVVDPRVLSIILALKKGQPVVPSAERREFTVQYNQKLRRIYEKLGKCTLDVPATLGTKEWYWQNRPSHCLRKSGSAQALRRCGYDYSNVSAMGWASDSLLRKTYAQPKVMLSKNCEYCLPPEMKHENEEFCSYSHYLAYQYGKKKPRKPTDDVEYLKARIRELESA